MNKLRYVIMAALIVAVGVGFWLRPKGTHKATSGSLVDNADEAMAATDTPTLGERDVETIHDDIDGERFTVEETVAAAFLSGSRGAPWNYYRRAHPDAKPSLYAILEQEELWEYHPGAIRILGYIGDGRDAEWLETSLHKRYTGIVPHRRGGAFGATVHSLGIMSRRGVDEASEILDRMATPEYWQNVKFRWEGSDDRPPGFVLETLRMVLRGYALAERDDDLNGRVRAILEGIDDPDDLELMRYYIRLEKLITYRREMQKVEQREITAAQRQVLPGMFNGDLVKPRPEHRMEYFELPKQPPEPEEQLVRKTGTAEELGEEFVERAKREANEAFEEIREQILAGEFDATIPRLIDDGEPLKMETVRTQRQHFEKSMNVEQGALRALAERKPDIEKTHVERLTVTRPDGTVETEDVRVEFKLADTRELALEHFIPELISGGRKLHGGSFDERDGSMVIVMRRINGQWYWNPFGW